MTVLKMSSSRSNTIQVRFLGLWADLYHEEHNGEKSAYVTIPISSIPSDHKLFDCIPDNDTGVGDLGIRCPIDDSAIDYKAQDMRDYVPHDLQ